MVKLTFSNPFFIKGASSGLVDSCYQKDKLTYCAGTSHLNKTCRYSNLAWGIFIGVPALVVIIAIVVGVIVMKKRNSGTAA